MITDRATLLDLLRGGSQDTLHLCHVKAEHQWILIGVDGRRPPPHVVADSVVSGKLAAVMIVQKLVIDLFEGKRGKYENDIYHLTELVPAETVVYINQHWSKP